MIDLFPRSSERSPLNRAKWVQGVNGDDRNPETSLNEPRSTASTTERLRVIQAAIEEILARRELSPEAKVRGVRALKKARARLLSDNGSS